MNRFFLYISLLLASGLFLNSMSYASERDAFSFAVDESSLVYSGSHDLGSLSSLDLSDDDDTQIPDLVFQVDKLLGRVCITRFPEQCFQASIDQPYAIRAPPLSDSFV